MYNLQITRSSGEIFSAVHFMFGSAILKILYSAKSRRSPVRCHHYRPKNYHLTQVNGINIYICLGNMLTNYDQEKLKVFRLIIRIKPFVKIDFLQIFTKISNFAFEQNSALICLCDINFFLFN